MNTSEDNVTDLKQPDDDKLHIFISHKIIDQELAETVRDRLLAFGNDRMEIFLSEQVPIGETWSDKIHKALKHSDWLIFIYTDPSRGWDWCLYETGFFAGNAQASGSNRLVCLYAKGVDIPDPVKGWQAVQADEKSIENLLRQIYTKQPREGVKAIRKDDNSSYALKWYAESAKLIAESLMPAPKIEHYSRYLKLTLNKEQIDTFRKNGGATLPDDVIIDGDFADNALSLFDLKQGSFGWSDFADTLEQNKQDAWVDELCLQLSKVLAHKTIHNQTLPIFTTSQNHDFYCPVVHRVERTKDDSLTLWLLFLPTSTPPSKVVNYTRPFIRASSGANGVIVEASPQLEKLYGQSQLAGTSLREYVESLTSKMETAQVDAFIKEQFQLIGQLEQGIQSINAEVCIVFASEPEKAYLPIITRHFRRQSEKYIDVIYIDVSNIAKEENGVKTCKLQ